MRRKIVPAVLLCMATALILGAALVWPAAATAQSGLDPRFEVHLSDWGSGVIVEYWPTLGTLVTVTVDDPATLPDPDYFDQGTTVVSGEDYGFYVGFDVNFLPGFEVTVTDGLTTESHTVTDIAVTEVDTAADVVRGTAAPGSEVVVFADPWEPQGVLLTFAASGGTWMVDFSAVVDIVPGTTGCAEQLDTEGNSTVYHWEALRPEGRQHNPANRHNYLYVGSYMSWADAEAHAVTLGGHLVTINDAAEDAWLAATFGTEYFIGLNDIAAEGEWVWASGEPVTFTGWLDGEPNDDFGPAGEDVVMIWNRPPIGWNDIPVDSLAPFVVEFGAADTTAPTTDAKGYDDGWHNHPVTVSFKAKDNPGGSGVAKTEYKLDAGSWTMGTSVTVAAPAGGANDGTHSIAYRSTDEAGNVEAAKTCTVSIDTRRPAAFAPYSAAAQQHTAIWLHFIVYDAAPNGTYGYVEILVSTLEGRVAMRFRPAYFATLAGPHDFGFRCDMPKGTYRFFVFATDAAGNEQTAVGSNVFDVY